MESRVDVIGKRASGIESRRASRSRVVRVHPARAIVRRPCAPNVPCAFDEARAMASSREVVRFLAVSSTASDQPATNSRDANSPIMMLGALVLAEGIVGMTEA